MGQMLFGIWGMICGERRIGNFEMLYSRYVAVSYWGEEFTHVSEEYCVLERGVFSVVEGYNGLWWSLSVRLSKGRIFVRNFTSTHRAVGPRLSDDWLPFYSLRDPEYFWMRVLEVLREVQVVLPRVWGLHINSTRVAQSTFFGWSPVQESKLLPGHTVHTHEEIYTEYCTYMWERMKERKKIFFCWEIYTCHWSFLC